MVKKKGKSKRITLKDKYKIQRRVAETGRKRKKQAKRDAKNGIVRPSDLKKRDPGIPSSWPFKQELLKDIAKARERQQQSQQDKKEKRKIELKALREHQAEGGACKTVEELMAKVQNDQLAFAARGGAVATTAGGASATASATTSGDEKGDGAVAAGQQSRRAYLRELKKVVDTADVLLQVLDARDPPGSRIHKTLEDVILGRADKRMVLVLNKIDLVPKDVVGRWLTVLRRSHPTVAIKAGREARGKDNVEEDPATSNSPVGMDGLLQLLKNYARTGGKSKTTIVVGVIGYPNVGKSSIINALKRSRAVGVSPRPGFTTSMQEVVLDRNVRLLDSPGVVFDDNSALLGNCVDAESIDDPIPPVDALLKRCDPQSLMMTYNIPAFPPGNTMVFLAMVAKSYGRVLKGGIPDKVGAARSVLKDWNHGKIPYYTLPPKDAEPDVAKGGAVIVSSFGGEFDLSKFDDAVLKSLKESDEMDFVQLKDDTQGQAEVARKSAELAHFLSGQGDDMDGDDDDEDDEEADSDDDESMDEDDDNDDDGDANGATVSRAKLAVADDFDFSAMS